MGIGNRIKEARERLGLTQKELAKSVGVTPSAITNYEKGTSHPKENVLYSLISVLQVDANFLFQDYISSEDVISAKELEHIKKYRLLDRRGQEAVDNVLEYEYRAAVAAEDNLLSKQA